MKGLSLTQLQEEVSAWSKRNFPQEHLHHPLLGVGEEAGELFHAHLKEEQGIRGTKEEHVEAAKDAIGDILIYLADYCARRGFSLQTCIESTWKKVKERDWKKNKTTGAA